MWLLQMQSLEADCRSMENSTGDEKKHAALGLGEKGFEIAAILLVFQDRDLELPRKYAILSDSWAPSEEMINYDDFYGSDLDDDGLWVAPELQGANWVDDYPRPKVNHEKRSRDNHGNRKLCSNTVCTCHVRFFLRSDLRRHFSHDHNSSSIVGALRDIPEETSSALDCHVCRALSRGKDGPDLQRHLRWAVETWKGPVDKMEVAYVAEPEGQGSYRGGYRGGYRWARGGKTALKLAAVASTTLLNRVISEYAMQNTCREGSTETSGKAASDTGLDSVSGQNVVSANKLSPTAFFYCAICSATMMWAWFCLNRRDHLQGHFVAGAICAWLILSSLLKFDILTGSLAVLPWTVWSALFSSEVTHSFLLY